MKGLEIIRTDILRQWLFLQKSYRLKHNVEYYSTKGEATDNNMAHAHCMLEN